MAISAPDTEPLPQLTTVTIDDLADIAEKLAPVLATADDSQPRDVLDPQQAQRVEDILRPHGIIFTGPQPS